MKEMATHSSILAWKSPMDRGAWPDYSRWGYKESDMTEQIHFHFQDLRGRSPKIGDCLDSGELIRDNYLLGRSTT